MKSYLTTSPWIVLLGLGILILNLLPQKIRPITPAVLIYSLQDAPVPVLLSPFLTPHWAAAVARLLQLVWLAIQPLSPRLSFLYFIQLYTVLLAARAGAGFVLGRSVGWQYPSLFSHSAVYEPVAGFGPILLGALLFDEPPTSGKRQLLTRLAVVFAFVLLDRMPWGYMCGAAIAGLHRLFYAFFHGSKYTVLPSHTGSPEAGSTGHNNPPLAKRQIFFISVAAITFTGIAGNLEGLFTYLFPTSLSQPADVHIVMLTVPRTRDLTSYVMIESIQSYVEPWRTRTNSSLTVFAHLGPDGEHVAFDRAKAFFLTSADAQTRTLPLTFYTEPPQATPIMNHHAHLADAVRYANTVGREWTMFVEDDFALCGQWGWENFMKVMARLNEGRKLNGAFIGTGGSGLVFHRSLLPALEHMLSVITALDSERATHSPMPADVLMQQCLSGELLFCPNDGYVISSRMLMGHRGGKLSTGNRIYDDGKWACGWRHPQHGNKGAEVVVS